jgi:hypothetical protein
MSSMGVLDESSASVALPTSELSITKTMAWHDE